MTFQWCPGEGTPFTDVKMHDPGVMTVISNGEIIMTDNKEGSMAIVMAMR